MTVLAFFALLLLFTVVTFGSGLVMIPLLQAELVEARHLLSLDHLLYAITVGRVTPGQANLYVASIGYMLFGLGGATVAVMAISVPGLLMLPLLGAYERMKGLRAVEGFASGLTSVSTGLVLASMVDLARGALQQPTAWLTLPLTIVLILAFRWNQFAGLLAAIACGSMLEWLR